MEEHSKVECERDSLSPFSVDQTWSLHLGEGSVFTKTYPSSKFLLPLSPPSNHAGLTWGFCPKRRGEGGWRVPCFVCTQGEEVHMHMCSHTASTSLQSAFPEGTCHHVNLLLTSSFLLLSRANWPFPSSREHHRRCWQPPHSHQHLTH